MRLSVVQLRPVYISAVALLTACSLDVIPSGPGLRGNEAMSRAVPLSDVLPNQATRTGYCDIKAVERDAKGKYVRRVPARRQVITLRTDEQDSLVSAYGALRFDEFGRQSHEAYCRLPRGRAALARLGQLFSEQTDELRASPGTGIAHTIGVGTTCYWIDDDPGSINYDIICGGEVCTSLPAELLRATPYTKSALKAKAPIGPHSSTLAAWSCSGGGGISLGSHGLFTYHNPGSELPSPPPSGGGGAPCSGGSTPSDTTGDKWSPNDELRWGVSICGDPSVPSTPPDGWSQAEWDELSVGEKALFWTNPALWTSRRLHMGSLRSQAYYQSQEAVGKTILDRRCDNNQQNAIQHAIFAAGLARAYGPADARAWTEAHEDLGRQLTQAEFRSRQMDLLNNEVGIAAAGASGPDGSPLADVLLVRAQLVWFDNTPCINAP